MAQFKDLGKAKSYAKNFAIKSCAQMVVVEKVNKKGEKIYQPKKAQRPGKIKDKIVFEYNGIPENQAMLKRKVDELKKRKMKEELARRIAKNKK